MMKRIILTTLPALLAVACGSSDGSKTDARSSDTRATDQPDAAAPDAPAPLDAQVAQDVPVKQVDAPSAIDAPPASLDLAVPIDRPLPEAAPPTSLDAGPDHYDYDRPPIAIDGGGAVVDAARMDAWLVTYPDGRVLTVVPACQIDTTVPADGSCPSTYAAGLAKVRDTLDASPSFSHTGAGRCLEGSYVYAPIMDTSALACYYDASTQMLIGVVSYNDTLQPCHQGDTLSFTFYRGQNPPCTDITWEAFK